MFVGEDSSSEGEGFRPGSIVEGPPCPGAFGGARPS